MDRKYVDLLISEYVRRKSVNSRFSERAFARAIGLSPGFLKLLFQGKKHLSVSRAQRIANKLSWTESVKVSFLQNVQSRSVKSSRALSGKFLVSDKDFFEVSDWFHFAIVELIKTKKGSVTTDEICRQLEISKTEASFALKHLARLGIVKKTDDTTYQVADSYEVPSTSSEGIRKYHKQILARAYEAVETQSVNERDLRGLTLAFDRSQLEQAKKEIQRFVTKFEKKFGTIEPDSVYQLSLALFRLDKGSL